MHIAAEDENEEETPNTDLESVAKPTKIEAELEDVKEQVSPYNINNYKEHNCSEVMNQFVKIT